jgi:hypothetical protein
MTTKDDSHAQAFSRTGTTCPFGKFEHCVKVYLTEDDYNQFLRVAAELEQVPGELGRDVVSKFLHGQTILERVAKHRANLLDRQGLNQALGRVAQ